MILVDTTVWIDHFDQSLPPLLRELQEGNVLMHSFVLGEIACGRLKNREAVLRDLGKLPAIQIANNREALQFIERHRLMGRGIGYVDVHLLTSAAIEGATWFWTRDQRLKQVAIELSLAFRE